MPLLTFPSSHTLRNLVSKGKLLKTFCSIVDQALCFVAGGMQQRNTLGLKLQTELLISWSSDVLKSGHRETVIKEQNVQCTNTRPETKTLPQAEGLPAATLKLILFMESFSCHYTFTWVPSAHFPIGPALQPALSIQHPVNSAATFLSLMLFTYLSDSLEQDLHWESN